MVKYGVEVMHISSDLDHHSWKGLKLLDRDFPAVDGREIKMVRGSPLDSYDLHRRI